MLTATTANKHLTNLSTYWNWLEQHGRLPEGLKNPFPGLKSKRSRGRAARDERMMWPERLERKLYESPVWTGCHSIHRRSKPGPNIYRDALFWIPLLGRLLGAREDELCCRKVGDIKFLEGVAYLKNPRLEDLLLRSQPAVSGARLVFRLSRISLLWP